MLSYSPGEGSVSIWESSGSSSLHTQVSLEGVSRVQVSAPGAKYISSKMGLETGLTVDTQVKIIKILWP